MEVCTPINGNTIIHFYIIEINRIKRFFRRCKKMKELKIRTKKKKRKENEWIVGQEKSEFCPVLSTNETGRHKNFICELRKLSNIDVRTVSIKAHWSRTKNTCSVIRGI